MSVPPTRNVARCARNIPTSPRGGGDWTALNSNNLPLVGRSTQSRQRMRRVGGCGARTQDGEFCRAAPLSSVNSFLHLEDVRRGCHVRPQTSADSRHRGGFGASAAAKPQAKGKCVLQAFHPRGGEGCVFAEQLSCRSMQGELAAPPGEAGLAAPPGEAELAAPAGEGGCSAGQHQRSETRRLVGGSAGPQSRGPQARPCPESARGDDLRHGRCRHRPRRSSRSVARAGAAAMESRVR